MAAWVAYFIAVFDGTIPVVAVPRLHALGEIENPVGAVAGSDAAA